MSNLLACVMNIITFANIYCLYPAGTLGDRRSLQIAPTGRGQNRQEAWQKYRERGWEMVKYPNWKERGGLRMSTAFRNGLRYVGDRFTWTVPLDMEGVDISSPYFQKPIQDWVSTNSWRLCAPKPGSLDFAKVELCVWSSPSLRWSYILSSDEGYEVRSIRAAEEAIQANREEIDRYART